MGRGAAPRALPARGDGEEKAERSSLLLPPSPRGAGDKAQGKELLLQKKGICGAAAVPAVPAALWLQQCPLRAVVTAGMTRGTRRALSMISLYQKKEQPDEQRCDGSADSRDAQ